MEQQSWASFPEEALEHMLSFIEFPADRSSVSAVCKSWYDIERMCRRHVFIGNCYAVSPQMLIRRFSNLRSVTVKGKHYAAEYELIPEGWGAHALPWIEAIAAAYPAIQEIKLKRMLLTDEGLHLIARAHTNLTTLILRKCEGFSTHGLASIAANCNKLRVLDLSNSQLDEPTGQWINNFPDSYTSLEYLNVDCVVKSDLPFLDRLLRRCPNLKGLRLTPSFSIQNLLNLIPNAPRLIDLSFPSITMDGPANHDILAMLSAAFAGLNGIETLSGLTDVTPYYLPSIYPLGVGLFSLDLTSSNLRCLDLLKFIHHCPNLRRLWVLDFIEDIGLEEVAASCKQLEELRVLPSDPYEVDPTIKITERGLVTVAIGCPKLHRIFYFCSRLTNAAFIKIAHHLPDLTFLMVGTIDPQTVDYITGQPLDVGFITLLQLCKKLKRFWTTGLVTDRLLEQIGIFGNRLEELAFTLAECTDVGLDHVLSRCTSLRKLFIRGCPISGEALLANSDKLERLRFLWMLYCPLSYQACKSLAQKHPRLNVEVVHSKGSSDSISDEYDVKEIYVYRTLAGTRLDMPPFVHIPT